MSPSGCIFTSGRSPDLLHIQPVTRGLPQGVGGQAAINERALLRKARSSVPWRCDMFRSLESGRCRPLTPFPALVPFFPSTVRAKSTAVRPLSVSEVAPDTPPSPCSFHVILNILLETKVDVQLGILPSAQSIRVQYRLSKAKPQLHCVSPEQFSAPIRLFGSLSVDPKEDLADSHDDLNATDIFSPHPLTSTMDE